LRGAFDQKIRWHPVAARLNGLAMIRIAICLLLLAACPSHAENAGSAIAAMQTVASQPVAQNAAFIELCGQRGEPMPAEWTILLADPSARGGVREITIAAGRITSERTPLTGYRDVASRPALDRSKVSVDANSVFEIAQNEAVTNRMGFHWLDFTLASNPATLLPEWTVRLYESSGSLAGTLRISAQSGTVLEPLQPVAGANADSDSQKRPGGLVGQIVDFTESTAKKVQDTTLRTVGNVQEFLVGERTVGPKDE
jgi:hypothetical protein